MTECVRLGADDHRGPVMKRQVGPTSSDTLPLCRRCWDQLMAKQCQDRGTRPPDRPARYA